MAEEPPALERKDWLGAGGSVLAIALSVLGMNKEPVFRGWAVALMLLAAATGIAAIVVSKYRRVTTSAAIVLVVASVAILTIAPDPAAPAVVSTVPAATPTPGPQLQVSQVSVGPSGDDGLLVALDVTVRNDGGRVAVLTGVDLTIVGFGFAPACQVGGNVQVTGTYQATLPDEPAAGQVVHVTLHQQVDPGGVDRFTITLKAPENHKGRPTALASFVYLASLAVTQDAAGAPADGGSVLLDAGSPLVDNISYFSAPRDATAADVGTGGLCGGEADCVRAQVECWNANRATLLPLLSVPAVRSENGELAVANLVG